MLQLLQYLLYSIVGWSGIANLLHVNTNDGRGAYCLTPQGTAHMENITLGSSVSVYSIAMALSVNSNDGKRVYYFITDMQNVTIIRTSSCVTFSGLG